AAPPQQIDRPKTILLARQIAVPPDNREHENHDRRDDASVLTHPSPPLVPPRARRRWRREASSRTQRIWRPLGQCQLPTTAAGRLQVRVADSLPPNPPARDPSPTP